MGCRVGPGERKLGPGRTIGPGRGDGRPGAAVSVSLTWLGLSLVHLLVFRVSVGCLLSGGEKDVKLISTLIKQPPA